MRRQINFDLRLLWERPLVGAALIAALQSGLLYLFRRYVLDRESVVWLELIVPLVAFYIVNVVALTRERRRRGRTDASQQSL